MKTALLYIVMFFAIGELLVRFDRAAGFFDRERTVEAGATLRQSAELAAVEAGTFSPASGETRILIVGDSALHGNGLPVAEIFAERLRALAAADPSVRGPVKVLDATIPAANARDNRIKYFEYASRFAPTIVLIAYNNNDVYGDLGPVTPPGEAPPKTKQSIGPKGVVSLRKLLFKSKLFEFVMVNLNMQFKLHGLVLPGSEFHDLVRLAYAPGSEGWTLARGHMDAIMQDAARRGAEVVVYNVPELNMVENYGVFDDLDAKIERYFRDSHALFVQGVTPFVGKDPHKYALSRYDGHPNGAAHAIIAQQVWDAIRSQR